MSLPAAFHLESSNQVSGDLWVAPSTSHLTVRPISPDITFGCVIWISRRRLRAVELVPWPQMAAGGPFV